MSLASRSGVTGTISAPGSHARAVSKSRSGNSCETGAPIRSLPLTVGETPIRPAAYSIALTITSGCWTSRLLRWVAPPHSVIQTGFALSPLSARIRLNSAIRFA